MNVITATNVTKAYRGRPLYTDASFTITAGTATRIHGPNGSGKSVLMRLMCGFARCDSGRIDIDPRYLSRGRTFPEKFGIVIDRPGFLGGLTGLKNLLELAHIRHQIGEAEVRAALERVGLDPSLRQRVRNYSLGMKQKLGIAQAMMESPEVLMLDEPFNALDADSAKSIERMLAEFVADGGTLIYTSHDPEYLANITATTLEIRDTRILTR